MTIKELKNEGISLLGPITTVDTPYKYYNVYIDKSFCGCVYKNGANLLYVATILKDTDLNFKKTVVKSSSHLQKIVSQYYEIGDSRNDIYSNNVCDSYRKWGFVDRIIKKFGFKTPLASEYFSYGSDDGVWIKAIGSKKICVSLKADENKLIIALDNTHFLTQTFKMWDAEDVEQKLSNILSIPVLTNIVPGIELLTKMPVTTEMNVKKNVMAIAFGERESNVKNMLIEIRNSLNKFIETLE